LKGKGEIQEKDDEKGRGVWERSGRREKDDINSETRTALS